MIETLKNRKVELLKNQKFIKIEQLKKTTEIEKFPKLIMLKKLSNRKHKSKIEKSKNPKVEQFFKSKNQDGKKSKLKKLVKPQN